MNSLIPRTGLAKLSRLRNLERAFALLWGITRWVTLAVVLIAIGSFIDYRVDRYRDTPFSWVRLPIAVIQLVVLSIFAWKWIIRPLIKPKSIISLAHRVEEHYKQFDHRLITAIQLTRPGALTFSMSEQLIAEVALEAEDLSRKTNFNKIADIRQLKWAGALVAVPFLLLAAMILYYGVDLFWVLLQRQALQSAEIPRFNQLENKTARLHPAGDEVIIRYEVTGRISEKAVGHIRVKPDKLPAEEYPLTFESRIDENRTLFVAKVPPSTVNFTFRGWVGDGRSKDYSEVVFEPRPVVTHIEGWVRMPDYLGRKPNGEPYEVRQPQGDLRGLQGSIARIRAYSQKELSNATLIPIAKTKESSSEIEWPAIQGTLGEVTEFEGETVYPIDWVISLDPNLIGYRIQIQDKYGFTAGIAPRRTIQLAPDDPPSVTLLPERYSEPGSRPTDDDIIEGLPIPLGGQIPVAYVCSSNQGVSRARFKYRVNDGPWYFLELPPVEATPQTGPFDPTRGCFVNSKVTDQVRFHSAPSPDPFTEPNGLTGGGRFDFKTAELRVAKTPNGPETKIEIGDRIEYYVEVYDKNPKPGRPPGESKIAMKEVLSAADVLQRLDQTRIAEEKIRSLEKNQQEVFGGKEK
jgi:hypothetical protein